MEFSTALRWFQQKLSKCSNSCGSEAAELAIE